jgi:hypothetical protein
MLLKLPHRVKEASQFLRKRRVKVRKLSNKRLSKHHSQFLTLNIKLEGSHNQISLNSILRLTSRQLTLQVSSQQPSQPNFNHLCSLDITQLFLQV